MTRIPPAYARQRFEFKSSDRLSKEHEKDLGCFWIGMKLLAEWKEYKL